MRGCLGKEDISMSAEENKAVVRREMEELFNQGATSTSQTRSSPQTTSAMSLPLERYEA